MRFSLCLLALLVVAVLAKPARADHFERRVVGVDSCGAPQVANVRVSDFNQYASQVGGLAFNPFAFQASAFSFNGARFFQPLLGFRFAGHNHNFGAGANLGNGFDVRNGRVIRRR
jgi:hypothetical protein